MLAPRFKHIFYLNGFVFVLKDVVVFATTTSKSTSTSITSSTEWTNMLVILITFYVWMTPHLF